MSDTKYRIMIVAAKKDNNKSLYKYLLDGDKIYEAASLDEIDAKIEKMLNEEGYAKNNLIVINELEFNVFANVVNNTQLRPDTPANSGDNGENNNNGNGEGNEGGDSEGGSSGELTDPSDPSVPSDPDPADPGSDPEPEPEPDPDLSDPDTGNP